MKQGAPLKRGEVLVWATNESDYLAGRGKRATVVKVETVTAEGKSRGTKMVLAEVDGETRHFPYRLLWPDWDRYNAHHQEARRAARDAQATAEGILERLVALKVVEAPPTDLEAGGEGKGGVNYWVGPVRYRRLPDQTPKGVEVHLDPTSAARLLAVLPEA